MRVYYDRDADLNLITDKKIAIVGYGSQGHAHAQNLRDAASRTSRSRCAQARPPRRRPSDAGFKVHVEQAEAAAWADIVMILAPDEHQAAI